MNAASSTNTLPPLSTADAALADWEVQRPRWEELQNRALPDAAALAAWIRDWSELSDAVEEVSTRLAIAANCDTRDAAKAAAHLHYIETVEPELSVVNDTLNRKLLAHPAAAALPVDHERWLLSARMDIELFCDQNIPLHTEIARLVQSYDEIQGAMTVEWEGETRNLAWMESLLQEPDRAVRERAWRLSAARRLQDQDRLETLFDRMLELRRQIAANLKLPDFVDYAFKSNLRTDYSAADCRSFHAAVDKTVVPAYKDTLESRRQSLGLDRLRPWDLDCDPQGRPPLKPFQSIDELTEKTARIFARVGSDLAARFAILRDNSLMDLDSRVGKAPGGYQTSLNKARLPFIFMNAVGLNRDLFTLLHESGHAFHYLLARDQALPFNREAPMEFCEVASMAMERLGAAHLEEFYAPAEVRRAIASQDEKMFRLFPWIATIDAFQHWLYTTPHTPTQRREHWLELHERFGPGVDWSGIEQYRGHSWHKQLHLFHAPFYYIEYGIAQIGALQVWQRAVKDPAEALRLYQHALSLGGTLGLRNLFTAAGLKFGMDEATLRPLLEKVREEWRAMA